ncbi:haloalkane dehalogenase [Amycolatopsis magusensis]|uniref:Haloalkane dehalogenase n=1 Tax=Amycolatopsis magusensis TaxID=882444 RepID=A0ABS4PL30_9PSEU|nr:haloalkane dehalogenase [Amycolatopsis magusensis]MBP2179544.1 haloalkane dehalogenase [Amycolatopsis magusensis]MDI5977318.1 haloalkane dehalogenase [Amycolatopsis magusensis]
MRLLRTPDDRFTDLPDFDFPVFYADLEDPACGIVRMAYVEAGPPDGPPVLLLHGEPTWSFLYRKLLPVLADAGLRAIAPDLVGFGRSDKPVDIVDHSYARHVEWVRSLVFDALDLRQVTIVGQDWGGLIGLRLAAENLRLVSGVVAANTGLPTGDHDMPAEWHAFRKAMETAPIMDIARFVQAGTRTKLTEAERAAYDAPFPNEMYKAGPRAMPGLVPTTPDDPASAANRLAVATLATADLPILSAFSDGDPITAGWEPEVRKLGGAAGLDHPTIRDAGHFLQEDAGEELGRVVAAFVAGPATTLGSRD